MSAVPTIPALWLTSVDPSLFNPDNTTWATASANTALVMISTQFVLSASDSALSAIISYLKANDIELGLAGLMLPYGSHGVGGGVEGYSAPGTMALVAQRIAALGGTLSVVEMDEPLYYGSQYRGPNSEQASIQTIADQVAVNVKAIEQVFPDVEIGDAEPIPTTLTNIQSWLSAYQQATGQPLGFLEADVNWQAAWQPNLEALSAILAKNRVALGIIYDGDADATTGPQWVSEAVQRFAEVEADPLIKVQHALIETWDPQPAHVLPENTFGTLTNLALTYLAASPVLLSNSGSVSAAQPFGLSSPSAAWVLPGVPLPLSLLGIGLSGPSSGSYVIVLSCNEGTIQANQVGSSVVSGSGSGFVLLTGDLADVSQEVSNSTFTVSTPSTAIIEIAAFNSNKQYQVATVPVTIGQPVSQTGQTISSSSVYAAEVEIASLYEQVCNRAPDAAGLAGKTSALLAGMYTLAQFRQIMSTCSEVVSDVTLAYNGIFDGAPTSVELASAEVQLNSGVPLATIEEPWLAIAASEITSLYEQVVGRQPDRGGLAAATAAMLHGTTTMEHQRQVMATSTEAADDITNLVQRYAGRPSTSGELAGLEQWLIEGVSLQTLTSLLASASSTAAASIIVKDAASSASSGQLVENGSLDLTDTEILPAAGALLNTGTLVATGSEVDIGATFINMGVVSIASGKMEFLSSVQGTGSITIANGGTAVLLGAVATQTVNLQAASGELELAKPGEFVGTIAGFGRADELDLLSTPATTLNFAKSTLTVYNAARAAAGFRFSGGYTTSNFVLASDGHGGSLITWHA